MNNSEEAATGVDTEQHCGQPMLLAVFDDKEALYCERCGFSELEVDAANPSQLDRARLEG